MIDYCSSTVTSAVYVNSTTTLQAISRVKARYGLLSTQLCCRCQLFDSIDTRMTILLETGVAASSQIARAGGRTPPGHEFGALGAVLAATSILLYACDEAKRSELVCLQDITEPVDQSVAVQACTQPTCSVAQRHPCQQLKHVPGASCRDFTV
jgi:hypothetical protein